MITIGIDPDKSCTAAAEWCSEDGLTGLWVIESKPVKGMPGVLLQIAALTTRLGLTETSLVSSASTAAIEAQHFHARSPARAKDVARLGWVAGACAVLAMQEGIQVLAPEPAEWKGQVPKHIHHTRLARRLGWEIEIAGSGDGAYGVPVDTGIRGRLRLKSHWKHAMDAIGLALWAQDRIMKGGTP